MAADQSNIGRLAGRSRSEAEELDELVQILRERLSTALEREETMFAGIPLRVMDDALQSLLSALRARKEAPKPTTMEASLKALVARAQSVVDTDDFMTAARLLEAGTKDLDR